MKYPIVKPETEEKKPGQVDPSFPKEKPVKVSVADILKLESANETMAKAMQSRVALQIAGPLVMEGEHTLLFADTNLGKSIFATQIALAAASGNNCLPDLVNETGPKKVLYLDFELGPQQWGKRYANRDGKTLVESFQWPDNFTRAEIDPQNLPTGNLGKFVLRAIEERIASEGFEFVVVDNLTWLSDDTENGDAAGALMKRFWMLVRELGIAMVTIAHTPKVPSHEPISLNHLAGSKRLSNFADAVFALGRDWRNPDSQVYLKQLKERAAGAKEFGSDNVLVMERTKPGNFLGFEQRHFADEDEICEKPSVEEKRERQDAEQALIMRLRREHPTASYTELAELAGPGWYKKKVERRLKEAGHRNTP